MKCNSDGTTLVYKDNVHNFYKNKIVDLRKLSAIINLRFGLPVMIL
jgi:hypothetical protein